MTMKIKNFSSSAVAVLTIAFGGVGLNVLSATTPLTQSAQAAYFPNCPFSAKIYQTTKIRPNPNTYTREVGVLSPNQTVRFSTFISGEKIWDGAAKPPAYDPLWFKLDDSRGYVASAVVDGFPPTSDCKVSKPEAFFKWANGQYSISRLDRNDFKGECATLTLRYMQEVFLNGSTAPRAYGNGKDVASGVANSHPSIFEPVTTQGLPRRGAIISFNSTGVWTQWGHVGIVMESRYIGTQRQIKLMDSNGDGKAPNTTVKISDWIDINSIGGTRGWTNPR